jgi:hypothetical protein
VLVWSDQWGLLHHWSHQLPLLLLLLLLLLQRRLLPAGSAAPWGAAS